MFSVLLELVFFIYLLSFLSPFQPVHLTGHLLNPLASSLCCPIYTAGLALLGTFLADAGLAGTADFVSGLAADVFARAIFFFVAGVGPGDLVAAVLAAAGRLFFATSVPFCLAHLARCAAAIRSLPAALMRRRFVANSSGLKLVALFFEPYGRPRRFNSLAFLKGDGARWIAPTSERSFTFPRRSRIWVRRTISESSAAIRSFVFMVQLSIRQKELIAVR